MSGRSPARTSPTSRTSQARSAASTRGSMVRVMVNASGISTPPKKPCIARSTIICCRFVRERTGDRHHQEQHRVRQQIATQREYRRQEAGERNDHDLRHQIGGGDPAAVVDAGTDRSLDVGQRRVGDLDVQHRDEGADDGANDREPDLEVRPRLVGDPDVGCHRCSLSAAPRRWRAPYACRSSVRPTCQGAAGPQVPRRGAA